MLGARSEHHWLRVCRTRLGHLFPYLPKRPGYHKRVKAAVPLICRTMLYLATQCPSWSSDLRLLDATPVPCGTSRATVARSEPTGLAGYGYCAAHSRWYWGLKLYLLVTAQGVPVAWCPANPNLGEREVTAELLGHAHEVGLLCEVPSRVTRSNNVTIGAPSRSSNRAATSSKNSSSFIAPFPRQGRATAVPAHAWARPTETGDES